MSRTDQEQIDALATAFYSVFDNRNGRRPDFKALGNMLVPEAVITKCAPDLRESMSLAEFVPPRAALFDNGILSEFHEWEVEAQTYVNSATATRLSRYEKRGVIEGQPFEGAGLKSFQLARTPSGWQIVSILWEDYEAPAPEIW